MRTILCCLGLSLLLSGDAAMAGEFLPKWLRLDMPGMQMRQGDTALLDWTFANAGDAPATTQYMVFVHLRPESAGDADSPPATGADFEPLLPTYAWEPHTTVEERGRPLTIPADFPPGRYSLYVGMYNQGTGERVQFANDFGTPDRRYRLTALTVLPADAPLPEVTGFNMMQPWPDWPPAPRIAPPGPEGECLTLSSPEAKVRVRKSDAAIMRWEAADGRALSGGLTSWPMAARLQRLSDDAVLTTTSLEVTDQPVVGPTSARFRFYVREGDVLAASFDLSYTLTSADLRVSASNVREEPGWVLLDVLLPPLVSAGASGSLLLPTQAGRLVPVQQLSSGRHDVRMDWWDAALIAGVLDNGLALVAQTQDWDNSLSVRLYGNQSQVGVICPRLALRAEAFDDAARIHLADAPGVTLTLLQKPRAAGPVTWVDCARHLQKDVKGTPDPRYRDTLIYKIFCDAPGATDFTTFDEALGVIKRVHRLAPWIKQVVYLVGWQYSGHDTGYPATDKINERLGGIAALRRVAAEAAQYNAVLSYHDNFDDAYMDSPQWDESIIARDAHGKLAAGGVWSGGQSYILAQRKYTQKAGLERVRRTLSQMPVRESYHIDVLSAVPGRWDFNPAAPENTRDGLEGKFGIIREFNRQGVDVTSEGFTAPFVSVIGHSWHLWHRADRVFAEEHAIPLIPFIYHGGPTTWGNGQQSDHYAADSMRYGASFSSDWTKHISDEEIARAIYTIQVPFLAVREQRMTDYTEGPAAGMVRIDYQGGARLEDWREAEQLTLVGTDGHPAVSNGIYTVVSGESMFVYSEATRDASLQIPEALQGGEPAATNLASGEALPCVVEDGRLRLELPAGVPCRIGCKK